MEKYYLQEEPNEKIPPITSYYVKDYQSVVDRYFKRYYFIPKNSIASNAENQDHQILFHSNRICLVSLSKNHVAFKKGIKSINYNIGNCDRSRNQVSGKGKRGAMNLQATSSIALVKCHDNSEYKVFSCCPGKLVEVNERLLQNIDLLKIEGEGYIAVVLPKPENCENIKKSMLSEEEYEKTSGKLANSFNKM